MNLRQIWECMWPPKVEPVQAPTWEQQLFARPEMTLETLCPACNATMAYAKALEEKQDVEFTCGVCTHMWIEPMKVKVQ